MRCDVTDIFLWKYVIKRMLLLPLPISVKRSAIDLLHSIRLWFFLPLDSISISRYVLAGLPIKSKLYYNSVGHVVLKNTSVSCHYCNTYIGWTPIRCATNIRIREYKRPRKWSRPLQISGRRFLRILYGDLLLFGTRVRVMRSYCQFEMFIHLFDGNRSDPFIHHQNYSCFH